MTLKVSLVLTATVLLSSCSSLIPEPKIIVQTEIVERQIPIVAHPKQVQLNDVIIYVVSPDKNLEEFKAEFLQAATADPVTGAPAVLDMSIREAMHNGFLFVKFFSGTVDSGYYKIANMSTATGNLI